MTAALLLLSLAMLIFGIRGERRMRRELRLAEEREAAGSEDTVTTADSEQPSPRTTSPAAGDDGRPIT